MPTTNDEVELVDKVEFTCTCGLHAVVGFTDDERMVALHALPICPLYTRLNPLEYVTAIRIHYQGN